MTLFRPAH